MEKGTSRHNQEMGKIINSIKKIQTGSSLKNKKKRSNHKYSINFSCLTYGKEPLSYFDIIKYCKRN